MKKNLQQLSNRIAASGLSSTLRSAIGLLLLIASVFISQTTKAQTQTTAGSVSAYTIYQPISVGTTVTATQTFNIPTQEFGKSNLRMVWGNGTSGGGPANPAHAWKETRTLDNTWWGCSVTAYAYGKLTTHIGGGHYTGTAIWRLKNNNTGQVIEYTAPPSGKYVIGYDDSNSDWGVYVIAYYDQYPLPDFVPQTPTYTYNAATQQLTVTTTVRSNTAASGSPVSVALYKGSVSNANLMGTSVTATPIPNGGSTTVTFTKTLSSIDLNDIQTLIVRVNDDGTTFPVLTYETNTTNNESQVTIPSYTISYNTSIPSATLPSTNPTSYNILKLPIILTDPTPPTGYTFNGWTGSNGSTPQTSYTIPSGKTGNLTYTANYTISSYIITYALNGGTVSSANPTSYDVTTPTFTLNNPAKAGYTFLGWSGTGLTGTANTAVTIPTGSTGNRSYTANWSTPNAYTISYVLPSGTLHPQTPNAYTYEDNVTVPNPVLYGYTFTGWNITNDDATSPAVTPTINVNWTQHNIFGNLTFDANNLTTSWSKITYNITYDLDGGTHGSSHPNTYTVTDNVTIDIPTKTGYTFGGWTISCDSASATLPSSGNPTTFGPGSNVFGNLNFKANWTTDQYMITYNPGAADASLDNPPANNPTTYDITDTPITLDDGGAHRNGYTFDKWKIESSVPSVTIPDGMNIPANTTGNLTCTALWNLNGYTISYTIPSDVTHPQTPTNYDITNSVTVANPSAPGFTFKEWTITNDETTSPAITPKIGVSWAANTVFGNLNFSVASPSSPSNPNWDAIVYNITYDYDGGTPSATSNPSTYTVMTPAITLHEPTKTGYTFTGWTFVSSESSVLIPAGNTIPQGTIGNLTCTAVWNTVPYNITYTDHATGSPVVTSPANPTSYHVATPDFRLNNPPAKDSKHRFVGWTGTDIVGGKHLLVNVPTGSMGDRAYEAHWSSALRDRYTLANDTLLIACEAPQRIESGHDGLSYEWIFPDGTPHTSPDIDATVNGRYILRTNYGDTIVNDTIYVQLAFEAGQSISRLSTLPIKIGKSQQFSVNIPAGLHSYTTYAWTFEGGTPATSTLATPDVVWNTTGEKRISVSISITHGTLTCNKTFETKVHVYPKQRGLFVDQNVSGGALDGSSWSNAFKTIEDALSNASQGDFIWVAQGEYTPPTGTAYRMQTDSIEIYGGFNATESYLYERELGQHPTVLKGSGTSVIENINMPSGGARWDGFTVEGGKATHGAGIYNSNASVTIANSIIRHNTASEEGGGVWSTLGNPVYINVEVSGNSAKQGAGMYHIAAFPTLLNVTIAGNKAIERAGGLYNDGGAADIQNTIIYGNQAPADASVKNDGSAMVYSHSLIEGSGGSSAWNSVYGNDNGSNKDANPIFLRSGFDEDGTMREGKYQLAAQSPAVDVARNAFVLSMKIRTKIHLSTLNNAELTQGIPYDLAGNARIENSTVDMGAYEYSTNIVSPEAIHSVIIPEIPGVVTVPEKGIHYVISYSNFKLLLTPETGYNLKNIKIKTGDPFRDKDEAGIKYEHRPDGSVLVTIIKVMRPITIEISGITVANEIVNEHIKMWTFENMLHIETDKPMNINIYTIAGQLYREMKLSTGKTEIPLPSGVYIVTFNGNGRYKALIN